MHATTVNTLPVHPTLTHPRTGEPLVAVGIVRGRPIWPVLGGSGEGDQGGTGDGGDTSDPSGSTPPAGTGGDTGGTGDDAGKNDQGGKTFDEAYVKTLRDESAKYRTENKQNKGILEALAKVLNPDGKGGEVTPEKLTQQIAERDERIRELETRDVVRAAAETHSANVSELLDSKSFADKLKSLDHTAKNFAEQVSAEVKAAVEAKPALKIGPAKPPRSGADFSGADTGSKKTQPKTLHDAVARHYTT